MIICATGHRPDKLGGYGRPECDDALRALAVDYLKKHRRDSIDHVIGGMAQGWDTAFVEAAILLKIPFIAAVPFRGQESQWPPEAQARYRRLLDRAKSVEIVCLGAFSAWKMQARNEWMVRRANRICALWNGSPGGTANCLTYNSRLKNPRPVDNLWSEWQEPK